MKWGHLPHTACTKPTLLTSGQTQRCHLLRKRTHRDRKRAGSSFWPHPKGAWSSGMRNSNPLWGGKTSRSLAEAAADPWGAHQVGVITALNQLPPLHLFWESQGITAPGRPELYKELTGKAWPCFGKNIHFPCLTFPVEHSELCQARHKLLGTATQEPKNHSQIATPHPDFNNQAKP